MVMSSSCTGQSDYTVQRYYICLFTNKGYKLQCSLPVCVPSKQSKGMRTDIDVSHRKMWKEEDKERKEWETRAGEVCQLVTFP